MCEDWGTPLAWLQSLQMKDPWVTFLGASAAVLVIAGLLTLADEKGRLATIARTVLGLVILLVLAGLFELCQERAAPLVPILVAMSTGLGLAYFLFPKSPALILAEAVVNGVANLPARFGELQRRRDVQQGAKAVGEAALERERREGDAQEHGNVEGDVQ